MSNHIGIVMGGYLDENDRLMDREELNRRIAAIQKENEKLKGKVSELSWDGALNEAQDKINTIQRKLDLAVEVLKDISEWEILHDRIRKAGRALKEIGEIQ